MQRADRGEINRSEAGPEPRRLAVTHYGHAATCELSRWPTAKTR
jgi:hypothetical protein